jgi:hypothetical protein
MNPRAAIEVKRRYAVINRLVSDSQLEKHLEKWGAGLEYTMTFGRALLSEAVAPGFLPVAAALEEQLQALETCVAGNRTGTLVKNLLNGPQFLNTLSELALARRLQLDGWQVELASPFHDGKKDADVRVSRDGAERYVELVNLAPEPMTESIEGFLPLPGSEPLDPKLLDKVVEKYETKFKPALDAGWKGEAWIALDHSKKHDLTAELLFRGPFTGTDWRAQLAASIGSKCPELRGVVYSRSTAVTPAAEPVIWNPTRD